jgi:hypothetical protein
MVSGGWNERGREEGRGWGAEGRVLMGEKGRKKGVVL